MRSPSSVSGTSFRSGNRSASARISPRPRRRFARSSGNGPGSGGRSQEHGNDGGPRRRETGRRWRTGSSHSRAILPVLSSSSTPRDGGIYLDATFGAGGYTRARFWQRRMQRPWHRPRPERDRARRRPGRAGGRPADPGGGAFPSSPTVVRRRPCEVDGVVLDLGVSSMQLDKPERGFSFRQDGPLDMRMGDDGPSAADVVARASERDLAFMITTLGEERHARAVARAIVAARDEEPIRTTTQLAEIMAQVVRARPGTFIRPPAPSRRCASSSTTSSVSWRRPRRRRARAQARRAAGGGRVSLAGGSDRQDIPGLARPAGRLASRSADVARPAPTFRMLTSRPVMPDEAEIAANPRARSAKLRAGERTDAPGTPDRPALAAGARRSPMHAGACGDDATVQLCVIVALVVSAAYVYRIKLNSTLRARAGGAVAPVKSSASAMRSRFCARNGRSSTTRRAFRHWRERHLALQAIERGQIDKLDRLPERRAAASPEAG